VITLNSWLGKRKTRTHFQAEVAEIKVFGGRWSNVVVQAVATEGIKRRNGDLGLQKRIYELALTGNDGNRLMAAAADAREARLLPVDATRVTRVSDDAMMVEMLQGDQVRGRFVMSPDALAEMARQAQETSKSP
jgi:hypothetical protein